MLEGKDEEKQEVEEEVVRQCTAGLVRCRIHFYREIYHMGFSEAIS